MARVAANEAMIRSTARAAGVTLGYCVGLAVAQTHAPLLVTTTVAPVANLELLSQPAIISISALDIEHGYVDIAAPSSVRVQSNSPRGYELDFAPLSPLFRALSIRGLQQNVTLGGEGGTVVQRWQHGQAVSLALSWRFYLTPGLAPGEYAWPLHMSVRPLAAGQ